MAGAAGLAAGTDSARSPLSGSACGRVVALRVAAGLLPAARGGLLKRGMCARGRDAEHAAGASTGACGSRVGRQQQCNHPLRLGWAPACAIRQRAAPKRAPFFRFRHAAVGAGAAGRGRRRPGVGVTFACLCVRARVPLCRASRLFPAPCCVRSAAQLRAPGGAGKGREGSGRW